MTLYSNAVMRINQQVNKAGFFLRASGRQRFFAWIVFVVVAVLFGLLWLAGHYRTTLWPYPCGFVQRHNLPCPGCGVTRSAVLFAQGKVLRAFYVQPAAAMLCCVVAVSGFLALLTAVFGVYFSFLERFFAEIRVWYIILAFIIIMAAGWAVTLARALAVND